MKLEYVEMSGFRGFRDHTRLDPAGFIVLCGRNGAGKSSVLDAVDFALTGTINKFSSKRARGGGIEDNIWWVGSGQPSSHSVSVGFVDNDGERFAVTRRRIPTAQDAVAVIKQRLLSPTLEASVSIETLMQTTLIRDELITSLSLDLSEQQRAEAVRAAIGGLVGADYSERTQEIQEEASADRDRQQRQLDKVQSELSQSLSSLTEARSAAEAAGDIAAALDIVASAQVSLPPEPALRLPALRQHVSTRRQILDEIEAVREQTEQLKAQATFLRSDGFKDQLMFAETASLDAELHFTEADSALQNAIREEASESKSDSVAAHLAAWPAPGSEDTELGVLLELEVGDGEAEVYARVQA